jgi:hypothetical protein
MGSVSAWLAVIVVILSAFDEVSSRWPALSNRLPGWLKDAYLRPLGDCFSAIWTELQKDGWAAQLARSPPLWFPLLAFAWILWQFLGPTPRHDGQKPPLDWVLSSRERIARFLGLWGAFFALLVASLPTLALSGLILYERWLRLF